MDSLFYDFFMTGYKTLLEERLHKLGIDKKIGDGEVLSMINLSDSQLIEFFEKK